MALKVAVQMDPIEGINIEGDTTFLMMEAAQAGATACSSIPPTLWDHWCIFYKHPWHGRTPAARKWQERLMAS